MPPPVKLVSPELAVLLSSVSQLMTSTVVTLETLTSSTRRLLAAATIGITLFRTRTQGSYPQLKRKLFATASRFNSGMGDQCKGTTRGCTSAKMLIDRDDTSGAPPASRKQRKLASLSSPHCSASDRLLQGVSLRAHATSHSNNELQGTGHRPIMHMMFTHCTTTLCASFTCKRDCSHYESSPGMLACFCVRVQEP